MRLSKIKLAGFKSFVDPTTIHFPSNLIGVVGPNGCGKSNVIDAVRWVMGESSAKHLRGDSMADVIFNGSSARKPVGSASIELVFDNTDGAIGGQYAGYNEIAIRRVVSRDGTSVYYLNNTRCRRKDITHIFLGTGLGPRAYSIIEQGMISRIVEARPDDLRVYLEEAAGISKYKERRRETEHRIRHTRENLERLDDLREEVDKQLRHLQRQARAARRFQTLKQEQRRKGAELLALRLGDLDGEVSASETELRERETALEAATAKQRSAEAAIERAREVYTAGSDSFNEVQGRYYRLGAEVARLEQAIQHGRELRQRQESDLEELDQGLRDLQSHIDRDRSALDETNRSLDELVPELEHLREAEASAADKLQGAEGAMQAWQRSWEEYNGEANEAHRVIHVERTRIEHLERNLQTVVDRHQKVSTERDALSLSELEQELHTLAGQEEQARAELTRLQSALDQTLAEIHELRERDAETNRQLDQSRSALQQARGRLASLEALQQAALGQRKEGVAEWLAAQQLADQPRLAQQLTVEPGWETALETVLGSYLEAVCVEGIDAVAALLDSLGEGSVSFLEAGGPNAAAGQADGLSLLSKVSGPGAAASLLSGVMVAEDLPEALSMRSQLTPTQSVITREGIWLGRGWLRVSRDHDEHAGVLAREHEIRVLRESVTHMSQRVQRLAEEHQTLQARLREAEQRREEAQHAANRAHHLHADVNARLQSSRGRLEESTARIAALEQEGSQLDSQIGDSQSQLADARKRLQDALSAMTILEQRRVELEERHARLGTTLEEARASAHSSREAAQEIAIRVESRRSARESALQSLERMQTQFAQLQARTQSLTQQLEEGEVPLATQANQLQEQLQQRVSVESELAGARRAVEAVDAELRELEQQRLAHEAAVEEVRSIKDEMSLTVREISVRRESVAEQFADTGFDLGELQQELPESAAIEQWELDLDTLARKIERLGPINLAAIDEFAEQSERKEYLDAQHTDLTDALTTLENAIRKIDRETRTRFRATFDRVNDGLKEIFPRLFGGGHAYLELTGDDLLAAGVTVMARPPGKRISTIHLLSGGEKALTAVAMLFAIFELNPAPFCLLDEVDAPLDDANVGRFCEIVRDMSERVQFVFITHNKATMEMAYQLTGVTMQEPGVSRLVAVDIDEAVQMVAV